MPGAFAIDTNVYIRALRDPRSLVGLKRFLLRSGARIRLHAVVAMELRAGARTRPQASDLTALIEAYITSGLLLVPSFEAYTHAGRVIADLAVKERFDATTMPPSFVQDVVIAASCREAGVTLITENHGDFTRIRRHVRGLSVQGPAW